MLSSISDQEKTVDKHTKTELYLDEEHLQQITGGTPEDVKNWLRNLPQEHRDIYNAYRMNKLDPKIDPPSAIELGRRLNKQRAELYWLSHKTLSDGSTASRVGQLRPKKS